MKKILLSSILLAVVIVACENKSEKSSDQDNGQLKTDEITVVELKDFDNQAHELIGKKVKLTGTIDHVCKHGGQKMFIVNKDADGRVKIVTGEDMAAFNTDLEGESLAVTGTVDELRIDEEYLRDWEEELKSKASSDEENPAMHAGEKKGEQMGDGEHHEEEQDVDMTQINNLRQQLKESGKDHLSYFSIVCSDYEVVDKDTINQPSTN